MRLRASYPAIKILLAILLVSFLLPFVCLGTAQAQSPISAEVDRAALSTDETLTLTVTLYASSMLDVPTPSLPDLQGFQVVGSSASTQIAIINGDLETQAAYVYVLQPYQAGDLTIAPINVMLGGQIYSTQPITVHVTQGSGQAPAEPAAPPTPDHLASPGEGLTGQDFYAEAEVDVAEPYIGQQVVYTFRFYQGDVLWDQPQYEAPSFSGFWTEGQPEQREYRVQAAGRIYDVVEVRTILFPSVMGPVTVDPTRLTIPGGFFSPDQTLQSMPVELDVRPLPPAAPTGFNGAVGQYTLSSSLDSNEGRVGEPLTWQVSLRGQGNLKSAPDPTWPSMPGWRDLESPATVQTKVSDGQVVGSRTYSRLLVPTVQGTSEIPALEYVYFDPATGQYGTTRTEPIPVVVAPGAASEPASPPADGQEQAVEQVTPDIRHLKQVPAHLSMGDQPVTRSAVYWTAWGVPVLGVLGYFGLHRRQRHLESNPSLVRNAQARKKAKGTLARARKHEENSYDVGRQVLLTYLSDKLDRPLAGLTRQALAEFLAQRGVSAGLRDRVEAVLLSSELGRFAPGADDLGHARSLLREVGRLIDALEEELQGRLP